LFAVLYADLDAEFFVDVLSQVLCRINRAMLTASTTEREHQAGESTLYISAHMIVGQLINRIQKRQYLTVIL
jgi:hypothetical protein